MEDRQERIDREPPRPSTSVGEFASSNRPPSPPRDSLVRRLGRVAVLLLGAYVLVCVMLGFLQRKLIYYPFKAERISTYDAGLPAGRVRDIHLTAEDGIRLNGWHFVADEDPAGDGGAVGTPPHNEESDIPPDRPVVLYFSGNAANRQWRVEECSVLTAAGADVFLFDYRGYGDNAGSPSEEALAADARTVWNYAVHERNVPPERLFLYGESIGGGVAVRLASEMCDAGTPPGGLLTRSTFSSLVETAAYHYGWLPVGWLLTERYPSCERIASVTCPILMLHGNDDEIVPLELGRKLFDAAPATSAGGVPKRFVQLSGADHNGVLATHDAEIRSAMREFFAAASGTTSRAVPGGENAEEG